ncbi:hypothetical protein JCM17845_26380 [Iodidimonas gelatinilytica]|uniref:Cell division coordinator CpoB n=1 Tax=Iodidimonas gelatinilytica TaxID=1236966 RepID=A0A5A7N2W3_9PROT|nr:tol-pal system protein YbgF [Iodidimonas gelatinilytica]GER02015.1 hypothetical protein JCM17845_26380 [Iodidimonas gelatinilytica]
MYRQLVFLVFLSLIFQATPSFAQTRAEINDKIETLEKQLRAVQRRVFNDDDTAFPQQDRAIDSASSGAVNQMPATAGGRGLLADLSLRVDALESQLGALTGKIEELKFENRQMADQLSRFEKDTALRLQMLEGRGVSGAAIAGTASGSRGDMGAGQPAPAGLVKTPTPEDAQALLANPTSSPDTVASTSGDILSPDEQYQRAYDLLRRGQFPQAETAFRKFLADHRDHPLAGNAQYWLGESYYVRQDYPRAAQAFLTGYQDYGDGAKAADSLLKLGMTLAALGQPSDACAAFDELDQKYPEAESRIKQRMAAERARLSCN